MVNQNFLKGENRVTEFLNGLLIFIVYLTPCAVVMLLIRKFTKIPDELFRKILHFILLGAYIPLLFGFDTWWRAIILGVAMAALLFPVLLLAGKIPGFSSFVNERKKGEFLSSMLLALGVMAATTAVGWGIMKDQYIGLASVYAWGVGDGFAALIGKKFGKHKIKWKFVDNKKSYEGSAAMLLTSALAVFTVLMVRGGINPLFAAAIALVAALVSTFVELCSKGGIDTVTCPAISMVIIVALTELVGG